MKKYILCVIFLFTVSYIAQAQNADKFFTSYTSKNDVENVNTGKSVMSLCKFMYSISSSGTKNMPIDKISSVHFSSFENCSNETKNDFIKEFKEFKDGDGYVTLMRENKKSEGTRIMGKIDNGLINEILILSYDNLEPMLIKISGKFTIEEIQKWIERK